MKTKLTFFLVSISTFLFIELLWPESLFEIKRSYNATILEPLSYYTFALSLSSIILFFFSQRIFEKWFKNILSWFLPLSVLLIISGTTSSAYAWFSRTDLAIISGSLLVIITIFYCLYYHFNIQR